MNEIMLLSLLLEIKIKTSKIKICMMLPNSGERDGCRALTEERNAGKVTQRAG